jgi:poly(A) polymerase
MDIAYHRKIQPILKKRLLTGNDLIAVFGLEPGPQFKQIFDSLEIAQVEGEIQDREHALEWVKNYLKSHK